ncbi:hypothetical protein [Paludibacterium purpuratum]|uniref:Uncharacterized protein n=1 Tax=Paludibacterium purpuratum TaxID=1144873 RepID=A0A4R7B212_9NEIS|nr:hypothetical protein [Paludibacterium purpuratum]TDR73826.1 hypothetical protein DFP86_11230 [Paludibacterium purpuratum]
MSDVAPLLICPKCCSLDIEGSASPDEHDELRCRDCGHTTTYAEMNAEFRTALDDAVRLIHLRVARKFKLPASPAA